MSTVTAHIDLAALLHNTRVIKQQTPQGKILAMVKSNAYGHGAIPIAQTLQTEVAIFGVACFDEALELRTAGVTKPILVLMGFSTKEELCLADQYQIATTIHNYKQLEILEQTTLEQPLNVWLKIDTGMHRLGFKPQEVSAVYQRLLASGKVSAPIFMMTHFSDADDLTSTKTSKQMQCFTQATNGISQDESYSYSVANSSTILSWNQFATGFIRPGIVLYGASPSSSITTGLNLNLKPVMTLTSRLISIHHLQKGDAVGYGSTWTCPEDMSIGIVAAGYGDGYARSIGNDTPILVNGIACPVIGRIAMDMTTVDLRPNPQANIGDNVTLWGRGLPIEMIAKKANTIPYELFCRLTSRVKYKYYN